MPIDHTSLPVYQHKQEILDALENNQVIIVESPTGSGKTTQIPLILREAGYADKLVIGITQPRRIATLGVCSYIKSQIAPLGLADSYCAYKMRFYDTTDPSTRIKILTDGMLLQELKTDSLLSRYSVIMVDEAHERSLNIDFILGLLKQIAVQRPDLKIIISSATLNTKVFSRFFRDEKTGQDAPIISINARVYDVSVKYFPVKTPGDTEQTAYAICTIITQMLKRFRATGYKDNEDTLVFLPGEFDIKTCMQSLYSECDHEHLQIYPLYGRMNKEEQEQVFEQTQDGKMKVVLATNIAETSLTIDGIKAVIDSGYAKMNYYNQQDFTSSLVQRPVSRSSAMQRTGRAGRTAPGICYRLYSKDDFDKRPLWTQEEILRTDLSEVVLRMVDLGIRDYENFPYVTKPDRRALQSGEKTLRLIGAIDKERNLTDIGKLMVRFPLLPRLSRCVVEAIYRHPDMIRSVNICLSFLSSKTPFILPPGEEDFARQAHRRFSSEYGDFVSYQTLFRNYCSLKDLKSKERFCRSGYLDMQSMDEIVHVANQLDDITRELGVPVVECRISDSLEFCHNLMLCLGAGLLQYICVKKRNSSYRTITADEIYIHPGSSWFRNPPQYLLAGEIVQTSKLYARTVSPLKKSWVGEISGYAEKMLEAPQYEKEERSSSKTVENKDRPRFCHLFHFSYPLLRMDGKKGRDVAVIPYTDLAELARAYRKSSRHPKSVNAAIDFNGSFIHFGDRLHDIVALAGRIRFDRVVAKNELPSDVFYQDTVKALVPYLGLLMKLAPLKEKNRLGFVELVSSGRGVFFHVNRNFSEAVNNSAYTLLSIMDICDDKAFSDSYNRVVKLLD